VSLREAERLVRAAEQAVQRALAGLERAEQVLAQAVEDRDRIAGLEEFHSAVESGDAGRIEFARVKLRAGHREK